MTRARGALADIPVPTGNEAFARSPSAPARSADVLTFPRFSRRHAAGRRGDRSAVVSGANTRSGGLGAALAISTALHLALAAVAVPHFGGIDAGFAAPPPSGPLQVTVSSPAEPSAIAMPPAPGTTLLAPVPNRPAQRLRPPATPLPESGSSLPSRPAPIEFRGSDEGRVSINVADLSEQVDAALLAPLRALHPHAVRIVPEFAQPPTGAYPVAAVAERRQQQLRVPVVVRDDGRVDLPQGMLDDPMFEPSVHAALAGARAVPPRVDGQPATGWALLVFSYEYVGAR